MYECIFKSSSAFGPSLNVELFVHSLKGNLVHPDLLMCLLNLFLTLFAADLFAGQLSVALINELVVGHLVSQLLTLLQSFFGNSRVQVVRLLR